MKTRILALLTVLTMAVVATSACTKRQAVGTAVGAGAAGIGYEAYNKKRIEDNEDDFREGKITRKEYERRKDELEDRSVVY